MRVAKLAVRYPPAIGGAESLVKAVAEGLAARGHDVEVLTSDLESEFPFRRLPLAGHDGGRVRVTRFRARSLGGDAHYLYLEALARDLAVRARGFDVIHAYSYGYYHALAAAAAARLACKPFVLTPIYHPPWSVAGGPRRRILRKLFDAGPGRWLVSQADVLVHLTNEERGTMAHLHPKTGRQRIIPCGIDLARFSGADGGEAFRVRLGIDGPLVLYAGRLAQNKGLEVLLRAFQRLGRRHPDARLALVGPDGGVRAGMEALARDLGLAHVVAFAGALSEDLYVSALAGCDVFVVPSEYESFGIVALEAMACGKPVVASAVGGLKDVVRAGETGVLVPYGDAAALADALERLLSRPGEREALGARGRKAAAEHGWEPVVRQTEAVYEELAGGWR